MASCLDFRACIEHGFTRVRIPVRDPAASKLARGPLLGKLQHVPESQNPERSLPLIIFGVQKHEFYAIPTPNRMRRLLGEFSQMVDWSSDIHKPKTLNPNPSTLNPNITPIIPVSMSFSEFIFHLILHYWGIISLNPKP